MQADIAWFKSKIDWWLGGILVAVPILEVATLISAWTRGDRIATRAALIGCCIVAAIYVLLVFPVRYGITDDALLVHFGVIRQRIPFDSIREVRPTRSPLASAALSLDRLAVRTGRGPLNLTLISPTDREDFLTLLSSKAGLTNDGGGWVQRREVGSS